ncbi:MAG: GTPase Era, partial [Rhodospirillales bacterium]|nr:GTPase Era [Rhodospirillales bacterium]
MTPDTDRETKFGFVALLGAPNAGKSTLLNRVVGSKLAIVTPKVQTTRTRMTGIAIIGQAQIAFIDTPGIFAPKRRLDRAMVAAAWSGMSDADTSVLMVDADRAAKAKGSIDPDSLNIIEGFKKSGSKVILALNKIDMVPREQLLKVTEAHNETGVFAKIFMISATTGDGVDDLLDNLVSHLSVGPWHYPEDQLSDAPLRLLAAEITREQAFLQLHQELPYALAVETDSWQERDDGSARIDQTILIKRESQKGMVVGKGGMRIKAISTAARKEMIENFDREIHLFLHVKVRDWMDKPDHYR